MATESKADGSLGSHWSLLFYSKLRRERNICCPILDDSGAAAVLRPASGDLSEVISELLFFDDQKMLSICLDQSEVMEALHKQADPGSRGAHHLGEFFMGNFQLDANAARVFLAD